MAMTIKLSAEKSSLRQIKTDAVAVFIVEDKKTFQQKIAELEKLLKPQVERLVEMEEFTGKDNQLAFSYTEKKIVSPRLLLLGLGEIKKLSLEKFRRAAASAAKKAKTLKAERLAFQMPEIPNGFSESAEDVARAIAEGAALSVYKFDKYLTDKKNEEGKISGITVFDTGVANLKGIKKGLDAAGIISEAVYLARDLENAPSNEIYPE